MSFANLPMLNHPLHRRPFLHSRTIVLFVCLTAIVMLLSGCDEQEEEPAYLQLNGVNFSTTNEQGAATEDITAIWVFIGNEFFGAFAPDARVPMLKTGTQEVRFEFGVQENGRAFTPNIYEFYQPVVQSVELMSGSVVEMPQLEVRYKSDISFALIEGFETNENRAFSFTLSDSNAITTVTTPIRSGQRVGEIELSNTAPTFEAATDDVFDDLIGEFGQVWLEVDYLSDASVIWGVTEPIQTGSTLARFYDPGFVGRDNWTKIYFNLTEIIVNSQLDRYRFSLSAFMNDLEQESATIYLDNIKILYF